MECHQNVAEVDHSDEPKSLFPGFGQISTKNASGIKFMKVKRKIIFSYPEMKIIFIR